MKRTLTTQEKVTKKLASYSALAGAFVLANAGANAQVAYTDVNPDETYSGDGEFYELDLNGDGDVDFMFKVSDFTSPGFFYSIADPTVTWAGAIKNVRIYSYNGSVGGESGSYGTLLPYALNAGAEINSDMQFNTSASYGNQIMGFYLGVIDYPNAGSTYAFIDVGNWPGKEEKFIALKLKDGGDDFYGWARLSVSDASDEFTIHDYAYKTAADASIEAGEVAGVSIQTVIQNNQMSAYGYGNTINLVVNDLKSNGATVKVFNTTGQVVYQNQLDFSGMQITLDNAASGVYTVRVVTEENAVFTRTVNIQQ
jgi:hypothetical protein